MIDFSWAFIATIVCFLFSFFYYSPFLAGAEWMKAIGMDDPLSQKIQNSRKWKGKILFINFVVNLLSFLGLSYIFHLIPDLNWENLIVLSVIFWFMVSGVDFIQALFQQKNVFSHFLATIDDFMRIILWGVILFLMMV
jgi:hypothetical protein